MSIRIFLSTLGYFIFTQLSSNDPSGIKSYIADMEKEVELYNDFTNKKSKSSVVAIQTIKSEFYLNILFFDPIGNIDIEITNSIGCLIYQKTVNTSDQNQLLIEICNWEKGNYNIIISYENEKEHLRGDFDI